MLDEIHFHFGPQLPHERSPGSHAQRIGRGSKVSWRKGCWRWEGQNLCGHGRGGPALWASGVSELRQGGSRAYDLDSCGRLGRRDERARKALRCISRSLVSAPAVHHRVSRWRRPAAGWGGRTDLLCGRTDGRENFGERQLLKGKGI